MGGLCFNRVVFFVPGIRISWYHRCIALLYVLNKRQQGKEAMGKEFFIVHCSLFTN